MAGAILKLSKKQQDEILALSKKRNNSIDAQTYAKICSGQKTGTTEKGKVSDRMSAVEYRELMQSTNKSGATTQARRFDFTFDVSASKDKTHYLFTLYGKHLAVNRINSLPFRSKLAYKSSIKKAADNFFIVNKKIIPKEAFSKAIITPVAYNKRSRDDDANSINLKILRDIIVSYGFLVDDSRQYLEQEKCGEVISKEWKIEVMLIQR